MTDNEAQQSLPLLTAHRKTLGVYLRQLASLGADHASPGVHNGIAEARAAIAMLKADLRSSGVAIDDQIGDVADETAAGEAIGPVGAPERSVRQTIEGGDRNIQAVDSAVTVNQSGDTVAGDKVSGDKVGGNENIFNNQAPNQGAQGQFHGTVIINNGHASPPDLPPLPLIDRVAARARFAKLASDTNDQIPRPAEMLPPGSRMLFESNQVFTGRESELRKLAKLIASGDANVISTGIGGVGKTSVAVEFAWRYSGYFPGGVFWLNCAEATNIPAEIAACGGAGGMRLHSFDALKPKDQVELVRSEWALDIPRLLIFDNCEDPQLLKQFRPRGGACRVLVTSRNVVWPATLRAATLPLEVLTSGESAALLKTLCPRLMQPEATQVAEALGWLPLALHLAGSYLDRYGTPVDDYLKALGSPELLDHPSMIGRGMKDRPTDRELHVAKAFALSFDQLRSAEPVDVAAVALLARAACLAPGEPFPQALLEAALPVSESDEAAGNDRTDGLNRLLELGLIERAAKNALKLHRLIAAFVQAMNKDKDMEAQAAVDETIYAEAHHLNDTDTPATYNDIQAHLRVVADRALERKDERAADLAFELMRYLTLAGQYDEAIMYCEKAIVLYEQRLGPYALKTIRGLNALGVIYNNDKKPDKAQPLLVRALDACTAAEGRAYTSAAEAIANLKAQLNLVEPSGMMYSLTEQIEMLRKVIQSIEHPLNAQLQRVEGRVQWHIETAKVLDNFGITFDLQEHYVEAKPYFAAALKIRTSLLGPTHQHTARTMLNKAVNLHFQEDLIEAHQLYMKVLPIFKQIWESAHPDLATVYQNLGEIDLAQRDPTTALAWFEQALAIRKPILGKDHPDTIEILVFIATAYHHLGKIDLERGETQTARAWFEWALAICNQILAQTTYPWVERTLAIRNQILCEDNMDGSPLSKRRTLGQGAARCRL